MKVDKHQKRLKAIKLKYVFSPTKCRCCKEEYKKEKMWMVHRYGANKVVVECRYCQNCMHSAEDVLNEIDTGKKPLFGIVGIDEF